MLGQAPICPVCRTPIVRGRLVCPRCATPHHLDCWSYNGGCSTYGCPARPSAPAPEQAAVLTPPAWSARARRGHGLGIGSLILVAFGLSAVGRLAGRLAPPEPAPHRSRAVPTAPLLHDAVHLGMTAAEAGWVMGDPVVHVQVAGSVTRWGVAGERCIAAIYLESDRVVRVECTMWDADGRVSCREKGRARGDLPSFARALVRDLDLSR